MSGIYQPASPTATPAVRLIHRPAPNQPTPIRLADDEAHVWTIPITPDVPDACANALSCDELERYNRYSHPRARVQFLICRSALRTVLACYLDCNPAEVRFRYQPNGKPEVEGGPQFNLSHTDGMGMIAVATRAVGIDVETARDRATADALVDRFFDGAEREQYRRLPADLLTAAFLRGWTMKESLLKAVGCGARGLEGCVVDIDPRQSPRVVALRGAVAALGQDWHLACWPAADNTAAAIALLHRATNT